MIKDSDTNIEKNNSQDFSLLKNIILTLITIVLFLTGVIFYGMLLNLRDVPLDKLINQKKIDNISDVSIIIDRKTFTLNLFLNNSFIKKYRVSFGRNVNDKKKFADDGATPVGVYSICQVIENHKYHKYFQLNYPNESDAVDAFRNGYISKKEFDLIMSNLTSGICPTAKTNLGGNIGIHGTGRFNFFLSNLPFVFNWTNGSIALSDKHIDELFSVIKKGTKVVIK
ncbi:MAG: L,D-transpeptidase [Ignavibacterium sp.]|nr:L,D-transpeptidase [Ignavibacterium sp.]